jgi:hypothetical protein
MRGVTPPLPEYAFMAWCSVKKKHGDNFTFTFTGQNKSMGIDTQEPPIVRLFVQFTHKERKTRTKNVSKRGNERVNKELKTCTKKEEK